MIKNEYVNYLDSIIKICLKNNISNEIIGELNTLKDELTNFKIKIPFVGGFNAGKSSLINKFIGENILPEEITPETAIAAEIKYGPNKVLAHKKDGQLIEFNINEIKEIDAKLYEYIEVYYESENLRKLGEDYVLVDMPGFDSKIENHNKAIKQYLDNGVAFILVVDCEDGVLKSSMTNFIYELESYQLNFGVVINKVDKKIEKEILEINDVIKEFVVGFAEEAAIENCSRFDEKTPNKIEKIITTFNQDMIIQKYYTSRILSIIDRILISLNVIMSNSEVNIDDINNKIKEIGEKLVELDETIKKEEIKITKELHSNTKNNILYEVRESLYANSLMLANAAMEGEYKFTSTINQLLRPILMNTTSDNIEPLFTGVINNISEKVIDMNSVADDINNKVQNIGQSIHCIQKGLDVINNSEQLFKKFEKYYKIVTSGLAIMTTVIAPWLELIIVFLPEILKLVGLVNKSSQDQKLKEKIEKEIIPNIVDKLEPEIENSLEEIKNEFMQEVRTDILARKEDLNSSLEQCIEMKKMKEEEFNQYLEVIKCDIDTINGLVEKIREGVI